MGGVQIRQTGVSLLITGGIMLSLGVMAAMHRAQRTPAPSDAPSPEPVHGTGTVTPMHFAGTGETDVNPLDPPRQGEWEVLRDCRLVANKTNAAHHFHVRSGDNPFVFELYCAEAPEPADAEEDVVDEFARHFGLADRLPEEQWDAAMTTLAEEGTKAVQTLLEGQSFMVFTKWERKPDTHHFYAFVLVRDTDGRGRFLQDWLIEHGYARVTQPPLGKLPNGWPLERFTALLDDLRTEAQRAHRGAWGVAR